MPPFVFISMTEKPPWEGTQAEHDGVMREAYAEAGALWTSKMLPQHFTPRARSLYAYKPRTAKTMKRKIGAAKAGLAVMGGQVDNVWTGMMMRAVLGHQDIKARANQVTVRLFGPRYLFAFQKKAGQPDKAAEITRVASSEVPEIEAVLDKRYHAGVKAITTTKTTTLGSS